MSSTRPRKLLDQLRDVLRRKHYALRTEQAYVYWVKRYIVFHNKRHPQDMARPEIEAFLTHLAVAENVAASTQNQAFSALQKAIRQAAKQVGLTKPIGPPTS